MGKIAGRLEREGQILAFSPLEQRHAGDIAHFHERDGLYLFSDAKGAKQEVQSSVSLFYEKAKPESGIFEKIAQLPFPLTVSINLTIFCTTVFRKGTLRYVLRFVIPAGELPNTRSSDVPQKVGLGKFPCGDDKRKIPKNGF